MIKGLSEAVDKYIIRTFPARIEIPATTVIDEEVRQLFDVNNRAMRIRFAHEKKSIGMTVNEISVILRVSPHTVNKYLNMDPISVERKETAKEKKHKLAVEQKKQDVYEQECLQRKEFQ